MAAQQNPPGTDEYGLTPSGGDPMVLGLQAQLPPVGKTSADFIRGAKKAHDAGDQEAYALLMHFAKSAATSESAAEYSPTKDMGAFERGRAGYGRAVSNIGRHAANLVPDAMGGLPDQAIADANEIDAPLMNTAGGQVGNFLGETATLAPLGAGLTGTVARAAVPAADVLANPIARGAFEGSAQGGLMADPGQKLGGIGAGAGFGAAFPAAVGGVKKAVTGVNRTPEAQMLLDKGVELTPGQANPKGAYNQFEEATQSAPFVGASIKAARENAEQSFSKATIREAAAPGANIPDGSPAEMLDSAYKSFEPLYARAKGFPLQMSGRAGMGTKEALGQKLTAIVSAKGPTDQVRQDVQSFLGNEFSREIKSTDGLLKFRSEIRQRMREYGQEPGVAAGDARKILQKAEAATTEAIESRLTPEALAALRAADKGYGKYKVVEDAMYRAKDRPAGFTPSQLSQSVRGATDPGAYARGAGGSTRETARAGMQTLEQRSPPTGARLAALGLAVPTGGASLLIPALLSATKSGRNLAFGNTAAQKKLGDIGRAMTRNLSADQKKLLGTILGRANTTNKLQDFEAQRQE